VTAAERAPSVPRGLSEDDRDQVHTGLHRVAAELVLEDLDRLTAMQGRLTEQDEGLRRTLAGLPAPDPVPPTRGDRLRAWTGRRWARARGVLAALGTLAAAWARSGWRWAGEVGAAFRRREVLLPVAGAALVAALVTVVALTPVAGPAPVGDERLFVPAPAVPVVPVADEAAVAAPTGLAIPAVGLDRRELVDLGLDGEGRLEAPVEFDRVGWWSRGVAPGARGPAVLVGHVDSVAGPAVFFRLRDLTAGDVIDVPRADGSVVRFVVDAVERYPKDAFPTERVYGPTADAELRLITCGGSFDRAERSYVDNVVVFARASDARA
jgi:hypothetical protein